MASENVSKTVSLKDYIIDMQSAAVKGSAQYEVVLENNTDFIIKRRTATTDRELVILVSKGLYYIKDCKTGHIEELKEQSLNTFLRELKDGMVALHEVHWLSNLYRESVGLIMQVITDETLTDMCRHNVLVNTFDPTWYTRYWKQNSKHLPATGKRVCVVGGGPAGMTAEARQVLDRCDCIIGYTTYIGLIKEEYSHKELLDTGMTKEADRCRLVIDKAREGKTVALVSSGDAGVYGMAGIMHEVAADCDDIDVVVVAGVTAACSGAALLGAPLTHDVCLISLSDLLTPWEVIEKRLRCAAEGDFVIVLYNPASKKRADYLRKACQIIQAYRPGNTPAGVVRYIGRDGETAEITTLTQLQDMVLDMFSTVFIGNSQTKVLKGKMVTPRGYVL